MSTNLFFKLFNCKSSRRLSTIVFTSSAGAGGGSGGGTGGGSGGGTGGSTGGGTGAGSGSPSTPSTVAGADYLENMDADIDAVLVASVTSQPSTSGGGVASPDVIDAVIRSIADKQLGTKNPTKTQYTAIVMTVAHAAQLGATSSKYSGTMRVPDYGMNFDVDAIRDACRLHKTTLRKLARGMRSKITRIALNRQIEGNLAKSYKLEKKGTCTVEELAWVSDFNTFSEDPAMPDDVRKWLLKNYYDRFRKQP